MDIARIWLRNIRIKDMFSHHTLYRTSIYIIHYIVPLSISYTISYLYLYEVSCVASWFDKENILTKSYDKF